MISVELIAIGREILDGRVLDTNSHFLGGELKKIGLTARFAQKVDDDVNHIQNSFEIAVSRSQIVIVCGGLGPTHDDLTLKAYSQFSGLPLVKSPLAEKMILEAFEKMHRSPSPIQWKQALLPVGAEPLLNSQGTAPGVYLQDPKRLTHFFFLPGVPKELRALYFEQVLPRLEKFGQKNLSYTWATQFSSEGKLAEKLEPLLKEKNPKIEVTFQTSMPLNFVGLIGPESEKSEAQKMIQEMTKILEPECYWHGSDLEVPSLEKIVIEKALRKKVFLATVESCTGGLVSSRLTSIPRSSEIFLTGFVTYSNSAKFELGVSPETLKNHGAVSAPVAQEMAQKGLEHLKKISPSPLSSGLCVSLTGIAGPTGATETKPVGLCHLSFASTWGFSQNLQITTRPNMSRIENQKYFSQAALNLIFQGLLQAPDFPDDNPQ